MTYSDTKSILPEVQIKVNNERAHLLGNSGMQIMEAYSEADISKMLTFAYENDKTVNVISGGTKRGFGGGVEKADILLSLATYRGIVEHSVGDLTMTVRPGTTLKEITDELAKSGQFVALDTAWPEMATIGGIISANDSGPKRLLYGSARDLVIGLRVVYADGRVIRTGGKVVKNVAGYDMNKLFIGAMGTLGVISEVTIKLRPLPKYEGLSLLHFPDGSEKEMHDFSVSLLDSMMEPVTLELLTPALAEALSGQSKYTLAIAFEDREKAVLEQEKWIRENLPVGVEHIFMHQEEAKKWWEDFRHIGPNGYNDEMDEANTWAALKIGSNNMDVLVNLEAAEKLAKTHQLTFLGHGGLGHGISRVYIKGRPDNIISFINEFRAKTKEKSGFVVCTHLPFKLRETVRVWGDKPAHFALLEGIKQANDSKRILNRKRFVGGI